MDEHRWNVGRRLALRNLALGGICLPLLGRRAKAAECETTQRTPIEGPYFLGEPRLAEVTGHELTVTGLVLDATTCEPIAGATIVRWHANRYGVYEDFLRARMTSGADGRYRMQSIVPGQYAGLQRHIHFRVTAPGYDVLVTQWQIADGQTPAPEVQFDFVLQPTE